MNPGSLISGTGSRRAARWLLTLAAAGEIGVGVLVVLLPEAVAGLLLGATLDRAGTVLARMMGIALVALGLAWLPGRDSLVARRRVSAGFILYNLGVGLLLLAYSATAGRPLPLAWIATAMHLLAGCALALLAYREPAAPHP